MTGLLSWEVWVECHLNNFSKLDSAPSAPSYNKVLLVGFVDLPLCIDPAVDNIPGEPSHLLPKGPKHRLRWWRRHQCATLPQPILKNKVNANRDIERQLVRETDSESLEEFLAKYESTALTVPGHVTARFVKASG